MTRLHVWIATAVTAMCLLTGCMKTLRLHRDAERAYSAGDYEKAAQLYTEIIKGNPPDAGVYLRRADCFSHLGKLDAALGDYTTALAKLRELKEDDPRKVADVYFDRGLAHDRTGRAAKAIADYELVLAKVPSYPHAKNNLAWVLATAAEPSLRNPDRALELVRSECEGERCEHPATLDTLAAAHAAEGHFDDAVEIERRALSYAEPSKRPAYEARLALYEKKLPYVFAVPRPTDGSAASSDALIDRR
jgi:tetratricopeptide (TPR) repeat protein